MALRRLQVLERHLSAAKPKILLYSNEVKRDPRISFSDQEYRYTLNNAVLSREDRDFYEQNGYIIVSDLLEEELLDECCQRFADLCDGVVPKGPITLMKDVSLINTGAKGQYLYNKAQDILYDEVFEKYFFNEKLLNIVECFTGPNIKAMHSMLINKPPDSGALTSRHPLHQDLLYFPFRPADRIVAAWTALENVTIDNGCLVVIPGSHRGELLPHGYPSWEGGVNKAYHGVYEYNKEAIISVPMKKGQTIFFHPLLLHGSGPNRTKGFRRSISGHFAASECYYIDPKGTVQEDIAKEIEEMGQKRGFNIKFQEIWKVRSRLVKGSEMSLW